MFAFRAQFLVPPLLPLLFVATAACGGSLRQSSSSSAPSEGGDRPSENEPAPPSSGSNKSIEELHAEFLKACVKDATMKAFCACRWTVVSTELSVSELSRGRAQQQHVENARARIRSECSDKLEEPPIKSAFIGGCVKDDETKRPICECVWPELRKTYTLADFADDETLKSTRLKATLHAAVKVCAAKRGEPSARAAFMQACSEKPGYGPFCACAWKSLRARLSVEQIGTESDPPTPRFKAAAEEARSKCAGLRP
jgi:hypothetical protein